MNILICINLNKQLFVGYGILESHKRDNTKDLLQIENSCYYYFITSLLPSNADVCAFAWVKSLKLN
jgi:hypothetical protein